MPAGRRNTSGLFLELRRDDTPLKESPYSLENFRHVFLNEGDSTGYLCAMKVLEGISENKRWKEWQRIFSQSPMKGILDKWREELEVYLRAIHERAVAKGEVDPKDFPRVRFVLEGGLGRNQPSAKGVGRPSKEEKTKRERITEKAKAVPDAELAKIVDLTEWTRTKEHPKITHKLG